MWCGLEKKFSQDTMCVKWGLEWGSSRFTLLGIQFSVNLEEMEKLNYYPKVKEIENVLNVWSNQVLSPIGKITIIKTLVISKLNHLFLTLPYPKNLLLNQLTNSIFSFIWENKPDKIKRDILTQAYELGGLKMLDIENYIKGLKLTWIRRLIKDSSKLNKLLLYSEKLNIEDLYLGPSKQLKNHFWQEVFSAWNELKRKEVIQEKQDFLTCNIWKNELHKSSYKLI